MNVTLVENAEHDVHGEQRREDQHRLVGQRGLKRLRGSLEGAANAGRHMNVALRLVDDVDRVSERDALLQVEGDCHRGELPLMIDRERRCRWFVVSNGAERNLTTITGINIYLLQTVGILPKLGCGLHYYVI